MPSWTGRLILLTLLLLAPFILLTQTVQAASPALLRYNTWGGPRSEEEALRVRTDAAGNIYLTGFTQSYGKSGDCRDLFFNTTHPCSNIFLLKYDPTGNIAWQTTWGLVNEDAVPSGMALDSAGNIYLTGGSLRLNSSYFGADFFLLKFTPAGSVDWQYNLTARNVYNLTSTNDVTTDTQGNIYVAGGTLASGAGSGDMIILKIDPMGKTLWQRTWGGVKAETATGIAVDSSGYIYASGTTRSYGKGYDNLAVLKLNSTGGLVWRRVWDRGNNTGSTPVGIGVDDAGNVYTAGTTSPFYSAHTAIFLLKFNSTGSLRWQKAWGGYFLDGAGDLAVDSHGNTFVTGFTWSFGVGSCSFAPPPFPSLPCPSVFLLWANSAGFLQWQGTWGGSTNSTAIGNGVALAPGGKPIVVGTVYGGPPYIAGTPPGAFNFLYGNASIIGNSTLGTSNVTLSTIDGVTSIPNGSTSYSGDLDSLMLTYGNFPLAIPPFFQVINLLLALPLLAYLQRRRNHLLRL